MTETIKEVMELLIEYANGGMSGLYPPEDDIQELVDYILDLQEKIDRLNKDNGDITKLFAKEREETKRLHSIIKDIKSQLDYLETYSSKEDVFEDMKRRLGRIESIANRK